MDFIIEKIYFIEFEICMHYQKMFITLKYIWPSSHSHIQQKKKRMENWKKISSSAFAQDYLHSVAVPCATDMS